MQIKKQIFIRNIEAGNYLEFFMISAIASILLIRLFLALTNYPQIGGEKLHIAHMLWGGLLMLAAIFILISFLGSSAEKLAAILGGIGFGIFIDEIGKFITQDNDYFYQPSVAVIYVIFIVFYLLIRSIHSRKIYSSQEYLMNALRQMEEVVLHDLDPEEKNKALLYLQKSEDPTQLAGSLEHLLHQTDLVAAASPGIYQKSKMYLGELYRRLVRIPAFNLVIILFFLIQFFLKLIYVLSLIFLWGLGWEQILNIDLSARIAFKLDNLTFIDWAELSSSLFAGIFILLGIWYLRKSRLRSYRMFERSILVSIYLTQVFIFYREQFSALIGLSFNLIIWITLRFMIDKELKKAVRNIGSGPG